MTMQAGHRFGVIGAGAVGSTIAGRLAAAGQDVTLFARGDRMAQLIDQGVRIASDGGVVASHPAVLESGAARACDTLFLAVKADALPAIVPAIRAASHATTTVVPLCNGVPWWYFQRSGAQRARTVRAVDPDGSLAAAIAPERIVGAVVFLRVAVRADGSVHSQGDERLVLGAADGITPAPVAPIATMLAQAGFDARSVPAIRPALWAKVALNLATNPLSAITGATLAGMAGDPALRGIVAAILAETLAVAAAEGESPPQDVDQLIEITRRAGPFMTSMAQDMAAGRPLELAAIAQSVFELAEMHDLPMPTARAIAALAHHRSRS